MWQETEVSDGIKEDDAISFEGKLSAANNNNRVAFTCLIKSHCDARY